MPEVHPEIDDRNREDGLDRTEETEPGQHSPPLKPRARGEHSRQGKRGHHEAVEDGQKEVPPDPGQLVPAIQEEGSDRLEPPEVSNQPV